jgi:hypothetical protein
VVLLLVQYAQLEVIQIVELLHVHFALLVNILKVVLHIVYNVQLELIQIVVLLHVQQNVQPDNIIQHLHLNA